MLPDNTFLQISGYHIRNAVVPYYSSFRLLMDRGSPQGSLTMGVSAPNTSSFVLGAA